MNNKSNLYWTIYEKLEKDVIDLSYYVHFSDKISGHNHNQIWTYSNQIADLLTAICIQIESLFFDLYKMEMNETIDVIGKAITEIDGKWNLSSKKVRIISKNMDFTDLNAFGQAFAPMGYRTKDENDYYSSYCAVKHNRANALYKANINVLIRALAALFILNIYYSFEDVKIDELSEFDFSLGSEVFMVELSENNSLINDVLIIDEDKEYINKITEYADGIPDIESDEFLKFQDETQQPNRFIIRINK